VIYLDYNATSPVRPSVKAAMDALAGMPLNPASVHGAGRTAKKLLEDARATIAQALGAFPNEIIFTGSGTEANNMVLRAFANERAILVSAVEHASIEKTASLLGASKIPVDSNGIIDLAALESQLKQLAQPALVSVMLANNETGVIQPIAEVSRIAHEHGALVHCDAVQALGKTQLDWGLLGVDMLTISGHKAGGPVGAAALLIRNDLAIKPLLTGGGQELGRRAGTENITAITGFAALVKEVAHCPEVKEWLEWQQWLLNELKTAGGKVFGKYNAANSTIPLPLRERLGEGASSDSTSVKPRYPSPQPFPARGEGVECLPQTLCVSMPGVTSETQLMNFDLVGFAVSAGSACSSGRMAPSHVLLAMGVPAAEAETAIRISWGWNTTKTELEAFAEAWKTTYSRLSRKVA